MMRLAIAGAAVCLMVALVGIGGAAVPDIPPVAERNVVKLGEPAPNFQLPDLNGHLVALSDLHGKVVLLNFWATWCGPCRVEMPSMEQLYRTFSRKDFEILAVSIDVQGVAITRPFQQEYHLTFPILHDADYRVGLTYGARTLPMTFLVDRQGVLRHRTSPGCPSNNSPTRRCGRSSKKPLSSTPCCLSRDFQQYLCPSARRPASSDRS